MDIKTISASRIKTYEQCKFKYVLTYMLYECKACDETFYTPEMGDENCPKCHGKVSKPEMTSNWGAVHGTALHSIMENYALAIRGTHEDGTSLSQDEIDLSLDWRSRLIDAYKRGIKNGQTNENFAIWQLAKAKDVSNEEDWCHSCKSGKENALCVISGETLKTMKSSGCAGCPKGLYNESAKLLSKYIDRYDSTLRNRKILGVEKAFTIDLGMKDIHGKQMISVGFMDLVTEVDSETIEVIDHKFGSWVPSFDEFAEDIQVQLYSLAAKLEFPQYKECIITFDYIRKNPISMAFSLDDDAVTKEKLVKKWTEIAAPQKVKRTVVDGRADAPETSWKCKTMCDVKLCQKEWPKFKEKFGAK